MTTAALLPQTWACGAGDSGARPSTRSRSIGSQVWGAWWVVLGRARTSGWFWTWARPRDLDASCCRSGVRRRTQGRPAVPRDQHLHSQTVRCWVWSAEAWLQSAHDALGPWEDLVEFGRLDAKLEGVQEQHLALVVLRHSIPGVNARDCGGMRGCSPLPWVAGCRIPSTRPEASPSAIQRRSLTVP